MRLAIKEISALLGQTRYTTRRAEPVPGGVRLVLKLQNPRNNIHITFYEDHVEMISGHYAFLTQARIRSVEELRKQGLPLHYNEDWLAERLYEANGRYSQVAIDYAEDLQGISANALAEYVKHNYEWETPPGKLDNPKAQLIAHYEADPQNFDIEGWTRENNVPFPLAHLWLLAESSIYQTLNEPKDRVITNPDLEYALTKRAVRAIMLSELENTPTPSLVASQFGVSRRSIRQWMGRVREEETVSA